MFLSKFIEIEGVAYGVGMYILRACKSVTEIGVRKTSLVLAVLRVSRVALQSFSLVSDLSNMNSVVL